MPAQCLYQTVSCLLTDELSLVEPLILAARHLQEENLTSSFDLSPLLT